MNFVDAAVSLLRESQGPMHVEELCRLALERGLLDSPGHSPLRSLKGRLTTELKRGPESRVIRVDDDLWALAEIGRNGAVDSGLGVGPAEEGEVDVAAGGEHLDEPGRADEARDDEAPYEAEGEDEEDLEDDEDDDDLDDDEDDDDDEEDGEEDGEDDEDDEDEDEGEVAEAGATGQVAEADLDREIERAALSQEEKDLVHAYGAEASTAQMGALVEYRDHQTADEDRPMVPELLAERRGRGGREDWKARRERMRDKRRERREERERNKAARDKSGGGAAPAAAPAEAVERAPAERAAERASPERAAVADAAAPRREAVAGPPGEADLARRACEVLASIKGAQPVPVRQLAQMMRKRRLVEAEPDVLWRPLKSALLADHQRRAAAGLPPRVAYRGRDLFSYRASANAELEAAETSLETAAHRLRGATERALAARLVELPLPVLEQVVQLFLVQTGWRDVEWIKRVDRSGYAIARERGDGAPVMIGVRAGNQEVDRRGVGELRAGVAAKNLARGLLLAPRELGTDARAELERPGKPVSALCGLVWSGALVDAGIGVALRAMPVAYLDAELFDRLGET